MSGGGSGGGGAPSDTTANNTDTVINDVPAWEQQYLTSLLGQAQTVAAQPYQQFPGQEVAGLTPDQTQAFSNVEDLVNNGPSASLDAAANSSATAGANTASGISAAGSPYYQQAASYNPLATASPFIGAAANAGTPQGISAYLSPYTNNVVQGLVNTANQNWNNNILPSINDSFIGSGQYGSGRNATVLGQQANTFEQNLEGSVANALQSGYTTAGNQADAQAANLGSLANTTANATTAQAANLQNVGAGLGNLEATQAGAQGNAATNLANTAATGLNTGITGSAALQSVGQQQQTQNQTNITQAMTDFQNQTMWPETQTSFLSNIVRGLPSGGSSSTGASQSPATTSQVGSVSPLSTLAGSLLGASGVAGVSGAGHKKGGMIGFKRGGKVRGYADGGKVTIPDNVDAALISSLLSGGSNYDLDGVAGSEMLPVRNVPVAPIDKMQDSGIYLDSPPPISDQSIPQLNASSLQPTDEYKDVAPISAALSGVADQGQTDSKPYSDPQNSTTSISPLRSLANDNQSAPQDDSQIRNYQLLAMAKGFLTPAHSGAEALGNAFGGFGNVGLRGPEYENQQQDVIVKKFGNASTYYGLQRQNAINQSLGLPPIPLPNFPGMPQQQQQPQSGTTTAGGQIRPDGQSASAQPQQSNGSGMNIMQALQISNGRIPANEAQKYQAVVTLQAAQFPIPAAMAEEAKQYAQDSGKLANAGALSAAEAKAKAPFTPITARENESTFVPGLGLQVNGAQKGVSTQNSGYMANPSMTPVGQNNNQSLPMQTARQPNIQAGLTDQISQALTLPDGSGPYGTPAGSRLTSVPPDVTVWQKEYPIQKDALAQQMGSVVAIDNSIKNLGGSGMVGMGTGASARASFANGVNTLQKMAGVKDSNLMYDPKKLADEADFAKQSIMLSNATAKQLGARVTNFELSSAQKANPSVSMPQLSANLVNNMVAERIQRENDRQDFIQSSIKNGITPSDASTNFEKIAAPDLYVTRAKSQLNPIPVNQNSIQNYLPGTQVIDPKTGRKGYIPVPKNYPLSLPPINPLYKAQGAAQ